MKRYSTFPKLAALCCAIAIALFTFSSAATAQVRKSADSIIGQINADPATALSLVQAVAGNDEFGIYMAPTFSTWLHDGANSYGVRVLKPYARPARLQIVQYRLDDDGSFVSLGQLNIKADLSGGLKDRHIEDVAQTFMNPRTKGGTPIMSVFFLSAEEGGILDAAIVYQYYRQTYILAGDYYTDYSVKGLSVSFSGRFTSNTVWGYVVLTSNGDVVDSGDAVMISGPDGTALKVNIRPSRLYGEFVSVSIVLTNRNTAQVLFAPNVTTIGQTR